MERYTEKIRIRVTREELEHLKKCSSSFSEARFKSGRENFSGYLREKLLGESNYKNKNLEQQIKNVAYELRKIGTNVNQVAKKVNSGKGVSSDIEELKQYLEQIEAVFAEVRKEAEHIWQSQN